MLSPAEMFRSEDQTGRLLAFSCTATFGLFFAFSGAAAFSNFFSSLISSFSNFFSAFSRSFSGFFNRSFVSCGFGAFFGLVASCGCESETASNCQHRCKILFH